MPADSLRLRPITPDDVDGMARWGADDVVCAAAEWSVGKPPAYHREHWLAQVEAPGADLVRLAVEYGGDRIIGYCDLHGLAPRQRELGFVIAERRLWGRGLGRAAAALMLDHGFHVLNLTTIVAQAWDANIPSIRILQRLGMREIGSGEPGTYLGTPTHYRLFEITAGEWAGSSAEFKRDRDPG